MDSVDVKLDTKRIIFKHVNYVILYVYFVIMIQ